MTAPIVSFNHVGKTFDVDGFELEAIRDTSPSPFPVDQEVRKLQELACNAEHVLPARKLQSRMVPHVCESTLGVAMGKVKRGLPHFTVHDFRRTARTHLAALGVEPHVAERCLNHKLKGVEGVYNRHDYFEERRRALEEWGQLLLKLERQGPNPKEPAPAHRQVPLAQGA